MMGSKFPWESPGFLMTYSTTGIPIEESSNMTHHGKNFLISACEKSPTLTPFLMMPIRSTPKPARSLGNQCEILPPISNNGRINSLNPTLMANASYTSKLAFSRKSDPERISTRNHPGPTMRMWSGLLRLNQIWMTGKELWNLASLHNSLDPHTQTRSRTREDSNPRIPRAPPTMKNPRVMTLGLRRNLARINPVSIARNLAIGSMNAARRQQMKKRLIPHNPVNCQKTRPRPGLCCGSLGR